LILLAGKGVSQCSRIASLFNVPRKIPEESTYTVHLVVSLNPMHLQVSEPTLAIWHVTKKVWHYLHEISSSILHLLLASQCPLFHLKLNGQLYFCVSPISHHYFHNYYRSLSWRPTVQGQDLLHCPTHQFENPNFRASHAIYCHAFSACKEWVECNFQATYQLHGPLLKTLLTW
jgi:hypothetical protein